MKNTEMTKYMLFSPNSRLLDIEPREVLAHKCHEIYLVDHSCIFYVHMHTFANVSCITPLLSDDGLKDCLSLVLVLRTN